MTPTNLEWADIKTGRIVGIYVASANVAVARGWHGPITQLKPEPAIGWTTPDNGVTFIPFVLKEAIDITPLQQQINTLKTEVSALQAKVGITPPI